MATDAGPPETSRPRLRLGAYALCHDAQGRVLLCGIAAADAADRRWTLPGGGVAPGEPPDDAALRELEEEAGLGGLIEALATVHSEVRRPGGPDAMHAVSVVYRVRIEGGELRDEIDGSTEMCAWFEPGAARGLPLTSLARDVLDESG